MLVIAKFNYIYVSFSKLHIFSLFSWSRDEMTNVFSKKRKRRLRKKEGTTTTTKNSLTHELLISQARLLFKYQQFDAAQNSGMWDFPTEVGEWPSYKGTKSHDKRNLSCMIYGSYAYHLQICDIHSAYHYLIQAFII